MGKPNGNAMINSFREFLGIANAQTGAPGTNPKEEEKRQPTEDELMMLELQEWVKDRRCKEVFLPWLERQITLARTNKVQSISSHPDLVRGVVQEETLTSIKDALIRWADTDL